MGARRRSKLAHTVVATAQVGTILLRMGQAEDALATFERARGIISTIKNPAQRYLCDKQVLHRSAMAASHLGRYAKSRELYETILAMAEEAGDKASVADALHSLGMQYNLLKNAENASEYLQRAVAICGDADDAMIFNLQECKSTKGWWKRAWLTFARCSRRWTPLMEACYLGAAKT
jgi:tetratricopeptide (TPR) repeat protein